MTENETKKLREITKPLPVVLTDPELLAYAQELAGLAAQIGNEEERVKAMVQDGKARVAGMESRRSELSSRITRREELRDVRVEVLAVIATSKIREVRTDTGEVWFEREMDDLERVKYRQVELPLPSVEPSGTI